MAFQLDTSGSVGIVTAAPQGGSYCQTVWWRNLSPFAQGYVEALFASLDDDIGAELGVLNRKSPAFSDLAPETLARIIADCEEWQRWRGFEGGAVWRARQAGELADMGFPPLTVQLGDDGKVRFAA